MSLFVDSKKRQEVWHKKYLTFLYASIVKTEKYKTELPS